MSEFSVVEVDNPELQSGDKGTSTGATVTSEPIDANTEALHVDGSKVTQPVSATALPLPTGAATEATLATIDADTSTLAAVDYATQTTLATLATETKLEAVRVLLASLDGKDYATQTTLAALLTAFNAEDFASETTLATRATSANQTNGTQKAQIVDGDNAPATVPQAGDTAIAADRGFPVQGKTEADVFRWLLVEDTGKLVTASSPPQPPAGTTPFGLAVVESEIEVGSGGDVSSPHDTDSAIIANGDTLFLQLALVGTEGDPAESGSKVEVYWVEGAGVVEHLVERFYIDGATNSYPLPDLQEARDGEAMVGNGTNTFLRVRRIRFSNTAKEVDFDVRGYTSS